MVGWGDGGMNRWLDQSVVSSLLGVAAEAGARLGGPSIECEPHHGIDMYFRISLACVRGFEWKVSSL